MRAFTRITATTVLAAGLALSGSGAALAGTAEGDEPGGPLQGVLGLLLGDLLDQGHTTAEADPKDDADPVPADVPTTPGAETPTTTATPEETPAQESPSEGAPAQEQPTEQAPSEGAPSSPAATGETPVEESPTAGTSEPDGALP